DRHRPLRQLERRGRAEELSRQRGLRLADRGGPETMSEGKVKVGRRDGRCGRAGATTAQLALHPVARPRCEVPLRAEPDAPQEEDSGVADRLEPGLDVAGELRG